MINGYLNILRMVFTSVKTVSLKSEIYKWIIRTRIDVHDRIKKHDYQYRIIDHPKHNLILVCEQT